MKKIIPAHLAVAFVWFSSHFGGGFASGRQIVAFYLKHQWTSIFMPAVSMLLMAMTLYFSMVIAARFKVYDYSSWSKKVFGPTSAVMSPLFEILFNILMVLVTAVAFATGGSTIAKAFGTSYMLNTVGVALVIFFLTIYGAALVRKSATIVSLILIACMFIIYIPNIIAFFPNIIKNFAAIKSGAIVTGSPDTLLDSLWWAVKYGALQCCAIGAYIVHTQACPDKASLKKAAIVGFIINTGMMYLTYFGILAFADQGVLKEAVPSLYVVMNGVGGTWMTMLISVCIILGAVSTGVALVYGTTNRIVNYLGRDLDSDEKKRKRGIHAVASSSVIVVACWCVAQFGLIPLIGKGYSNIGWVTLLVLTLPVLLRGFGIWRFSKKEIGEA
ncbi:YkvI family membrane protein [Maridesulfovibrio bastinii]|uniref:YkvI family membrane protein n=1 Tax=Maridesulfovibrio bastinii TaxID=47157 RepID=UPI00040D56B3|nr:hypothetical protein [Maridesulfovibrio bastinii]